MAGSERAIAIDLGAAKDIAVPPLRLAVDKESAFATGTAITAAVVAGDGGRGRWRRSPLVEKDADP